MLRLLAFILALGARISEPFRDRSEILAATALILPGAYLLADKALGQRDATSWQHAAGPRGPSHVRWCRVRADHPDDLPVDWVNAGYALRRP